MATFFEMSELACLYGSRFMCKTGKLGQDFLKVCLMSEKQGDIVVQWLLFHSTRVAKRFPTNSQRWFGYSKLPLAVNERVVCMCMCGLWWTGVLQSMQQFSDFTGLLAWCSYCKQGIHKQILSFVYLKLLWYYLFQCLHSTRKCVVCHRRCHLNISVTLSYPSYPVIHLHLYRPCLY